MKKWIALGVVAVLALTLILSCPSTEDHREAMKEILKESLNQSDNLLISMLGGYVLDAVADEVVSGKNFFFASAGYSFPVRSPRTNPFGGSPSVVINPEPVLRK